MRRTRSTNSANCLGDWLKTPLPGRSNASTTTSKGPFSRRVREVIADNATLAVIIEPLLLAWQAIREQVDALDRQVNLRAKTDAAARRLMTGPGGA